MRSIRNRNRQPTNAQDNDKSQKRRLKTKPLVVLIVVLFVCNLFWFIVWLMPGKSSMTDEEVASVDGQAIMREDWLAAMEKEVGKETLSKMVNEKVMEAAAKKYNIAVTDAEIDLEIALIRSVDHQAFTGLDPEQERQKIRANLILDKVLTKDVVIDDKAIKKNFEENKSLYEVATSYRTAVIILPTKKEANQTLQELKAGSSFEALAKEHSVDVASSSLGGDIGYIHKDMDHIDPAIRKYVAKLKKPGTSDVIKLSNDTFAIVEVGDIMKGRTFTFNEVKDYIQRNIALEQLPASISPELFWKEFNAKWFYEK